MQNGYLSPIVAANKSLALNDNKDIKKKKAHNFTDLVNDTLTIIEESDNLENIDGSERADESAVIEEDT